MQHPPQPDPTPGPQPNPTPGPKAPSNTGAGPTAAPTPSPTSGPPDHNIPTGPISYPVQRLLNVAQQIRQNVQTAQNNLTEEEGKLSSYARSFPDVMYKNISDFFSQYADHISACCDTQLVFAKWLEQAGYEMQKTDGQVSTSFDQFAQTHSPD